MGISEVKEFQQPPNNVHPPNNAYILNFCDAFFKMDRMETQLDRLQNSKDLAQDQRDICNLEKLESTALIVLHEWTQ